MDYCKDLETAMRHFTTTGAFLSAKHNGHLNTMTVSWGFIGFIWGKPHFITIVRPQRHTQTIISEADGFTISIPYGSMKEALRVCGTQSGRDIDKSAVVEFIPAKTIDGAVVGGCNMYYECRTTCTDQMREAVLPPAIREKFYDNDYHHVYVGEIVDCYIQ